MNAKDRDFKRLARLDQSMLEKEVSGTEEEFVNEIPFVSTAGEGAESVVERTAFAEAPPAQRGYRRLDEPKD